MRKWLYVGGKRWTQRQYQKKKRRWWLINKVFLVGNVSKNDEVKMSSTNVEIIEFYIDDIKVKAFNKLAVKCKDLKGLVCADGNISVRDYTNKDGRTYPIQEVLITKIEALEKEEETPKEEHQESISQIKGGNDIIIDPDELPFY